MVATLTSQRAGPLLKVWCCLSHNNDAKLIEDRGQMCSESCVWCDVDTKVDLHSCSSLGSRRDARVVSANIFWRSWHPWATTAGTGVWDRVRHCAHGPVSIIRGHARGTH